MRQISLLILFFLILLTSCSTNLRQHDPSSELISYNTQIRPLLSDRCFLCHGPDEGTREAGLRLDIREYALAPLSHTTHAFAIVPGKPEESELIRRIASSDPNLVMPLPESHLARFTPDEIEIFRKWIAQGAVYEPHWAFMKPEKSELPKVRDRNWPLNEIDHFIDEKMATVNLSPNEEAEKHHLLKRLSLDLTGLPPSPELQDAFVADRTDDAYENMVDLLLQNKNYGERMAIHWLDVARYADSYGYQDDNIRTQWPYRDWVIHAFNQNIAYDVFITWQLAGDMLPEATKEQILATAFLRNHKYTEEGGVIPEEYRVEYVADKVKTYTKGILAMTAECAHCHDHKYDPISQREYYQMFAFFNNTPEQGYEGDVSVSKPAKHPILKITSGDISGGLHFIDPTDSVSVSVMGELNDSVRTTYLLKRGAYDQLGEPVEAHGFDAIMSYDTEKYARNRLGLAEWTVSRDNPLTARVFVNQIWQLLFGNGIVNTTGDFGMQGSLPTHPELLDWLAVDFMENNWDIKYIIKKIVMSATYRQSARVPAKKLQVDPENVYLSRAPRIRMEAEIIRDIILASSGLLNAKTGGPSVKPYQPAGLWESATSGRGVLARYIRDSGDDLYRRGLYTFIKLTVPPPSMIIFDASNRDQCEVTRLKTNTPLQALVMMNDPLVWEASRVLAEEILEKDAGPEADITLAFKHIICRIPDKSEHRVLLDYYRNQINHLENNPEAASQLLQIGEFPLRKSQNPQKLAALTVAIVAIYNLDEAITKT